MTTGQGSLPRALLGTIHVSASSMLLPEETVDH